MKQIIADVEHSMYLGIEKDVKESTFFQEDRY